MSATMIKPSTEPFFKAPRVFKKRGVNGFPIGERTERRARENAKLRKLKINHCEVRISPNCARNRLLTWCHATKSRFLVTSEDWQRAARGCLPCHDLLDSMKHSEMKRIVVEAINKRNI